MSPALPEGVASAPDGMTESTIDVPAPARRRLAFGASAALLGQLSTIAGGIATSVFLAHEFGPSGTGTYALLGNLFAAVILLAAVGLPTGITFYVSRGHWPLRTVLRDGAAASLVLGVGGGALGLAFYAVTRETVWEGVSGGEALVVMAAVPFGLAWTLAGATAVALDLYERYASFQVSRAVLATVCTVALAVAYGLPGAIVGFALAQPLSAGVAMTSLGRFARRDGTTRAGAPADGEPSALRRALHFGRKAWSADVLQFLNYRLDLFILGAFATRADVGRYSLAVSLTMVGWLLPAAIGQVLFPRTASLDSVARSDAGREAADDATARVIRHTVILQAPTAFVLAILLVIGIPIAYGQAFHQSILLGFLLLPGVLAVSVAKVAIAVVTGRGYPQYSLYTTFVTVPVTLALYAALIPTLGAVGAALGSTASYVLSTLLTMYFYRRVTQRPLRRALVPTAADLREYPSAAATAVGHVAARVRGASRAPVSPHSRERRGASPPLTDPAHWDDYWRGTRLPTEVQKGSDSSTTAILEVIDAYAASPSPLSVLEIGGAPGGYLIHLWREFGHEVCVLDNSPAGVELTRRNFSLLGVPGDVLHRDLFSDEPVACRFDLVYSLGLVEHFADMRLVVAAHLRYLKPGGTLVIGCPNLLGINGTIMRRLAPSVFDWHELDVMDVRRWSEFEDALGLDVRFRGYIAGFQPGAFWRCERRTLSSRALARALTALGRHWQRAPARPFARMNSRLWSYYAIGVYVKPDA